MDPGIPIGTGARLGFSDSYHIKAHDQISKLKNSRPVSERRSANSSEGGDPPLRDPSNEGPHRCWLPLDGLRSEPDTEVCEHLDHDPKPTVQLRGRWHNMPLGVINVFVGLLINDQFAHQ